MPMFRESCLTDTLRSCQYFDMRADVAMTALVAVSGIWEKPPSLMAGHKRLMSSLSSGGRARDIGWMLERSPLNAMRAIPTATRTSEAGANLLSLSRMIIRIETAARNQAPWIILKPCIARRIPRENCIPLITE